MSTVTKRDNEGHKYVIPADKAELFDKLLAGYNNPNMSEAWYAADTAFNNEFYKYLGAR